MLPQKMPRSTKVHDQASPSLASISLVSGQVLYLTGGPRLSASFALPARDCRLLMTVAENRAFARPD
jgi:hypothetical protein